MGRDLVLVVSVFAAVATDVGMSAALQSFFWNSLLQTLRCSASQQQAFSSAVQTADRCELQPHLWKKRRPLLHLHSPK